MRVLWVDADGNPWTDAGGWQLLEEFGLTVRRVPDVSSARPFLDKKDFDVLLVRAELEGIPGFLVQARKMLANDGRRIILASSEWTKEQFKTHSKTEGAAHRYARVPMPPEGFLGMVADLFGCAVEELKDFTLEEGKNPKSPPRQPRLPTPPKPPKARRAAAAPALGSDDVEVVRKYLRIKEEQLAISEGEREELVLENERFQNETHHLQLRMRELEHLNDELAKKLERIEEEKQDLFRQRQLEVEEQEREQRLMTEKAGQLEKQLGEADEKYENLRVRVRKDIRKIRENERDLEARLELLRKDSETLLQARDQRVLEMQRKIDALEFDLDQVQDSRVQAQMEAERYLARLSRVSRALQIATGLIEGEQSSDEELDDLEPLVGGAATAEEPPSAPEEPPLGASPPEAGQPEGVVEELAPLSDEIAALADAGEPTQMISSAALEEMGGGGEPESSSG